MSQTRYSKNGRLPSNRNKNHFDHIYGIAMTSTDQLTETEQRANTTYAQRKGTYLCLKSLFLWQGTERKQRMRGRGRGRNRDHKVFDIKIQEKHH